MQINLPSKHSSTRFTQSRKLNTNNENRNIPIHRISINSRDSSVIPSTYKFPPSIDNPSINKKNSKYEEQTVIETHRRRSSPTTGLQSSYEIEHRRSKSPALSSITEEDSHRSITPSTDSSNDSSIFPRNFNSDIFYRSIFQPEIFTDDRNQRYIEMKLDINDYNPDDIKVSINDNDLIVQIKNSNFYKQITLPSNIDSTSLSVHYHYDKKLYITIKLLDEYSSFKYI
jgi:HSP20 family molecular chaperone IbpA